MPLSNEDSKSLKSVALNLSYIYRELKLLRILTEKHFRPPEIEKKEKHLLTKALDLAWANYQRDPDNFSVDVHTKDILPYQFGVKLTPGELNEYLEERKNGSQPKQD